MESTVEENLIIIRLSEDFVVTTQYGAQRLSSCLQANERARESTGLDRRGGPQPSALLPGIDLFDEAG
jgi:hypothetical protein